MWAWRPSVHKKYPIRAQIVAVIVGIHFVFLMPCFLLQQTQAPYHIQVNTALMNSQLPVIFVPFKEEVAVAPAQSVTRPKPKSLSRSSSKRAKADKKQAKAEIKDKEALKTVALKEEKITIAAKKTPQKVAKKLEEALSVPQVVKKELAQEIKQEVALKQKPSQEEPINALRVSTSACPAIALAKAELEQLTMQNTIQSILSISWQPPVGLPDDVACQISFKVGKAGEIAELAMIKPSGILMYDIAVQNALYESSGRLPHYSYGKEFCITFTQ